MFLVNSRHPLVCAPRARLPEHGALFSRSYEGNLPSSFNTILSSALVCSTSPPVSVWGTVYKLELFPGTPSRHSQSDKGARLTEFVTSSRPRNINLVPIAYASRPRLRGRLTLRGLTLRRNPWTFGGSVSRTPFRYSCQHSHFPYLQGPSRDPFAGLGNAPLLRQKTEPRNQKSGRRHFGHSCQLRASPCSIFEISWYSSRHLCQVPSSMQPRSTAYRIHTSISSLDPIAIITNRLNSAAERRCLANPSARFAGMDLLARRS